jgi:hypothetical protein
MSYKGAVNEPSIGLNFAGVRAMKTRTFVLISCVAILGLVATINPSIAQKTAKACEDEWKANKADIQAKGTKKKDFISACRGEASSAGTLPKPASTSASTTTSAKACEDQWKANKASIQASGKKKKDFISECRGGASSAAAPANPSPAPSVTTTAKQKPTVSTRPTATSGSGTPSGANQYATETAAKVRCPLDTIVWVNTKSGIYHFSGHKDFGNTKSGAYMCEKDTGAEGFRAAKNEKHP